RSPGSRLRQRTCGGSWDAADHGPRGRIDDDFVDAARARERNLPVAHIAQHELRRAFLRRTPAAAPAGLVADDVPGPQRERDLRAEFARLAVGIENVISLASFLAAVESPWTPTVAVGEDREADLVVVELVVPAQPESTAMFPWTIGILDQLVAQDADRVV